MRHVFISHLPGRSRVAQGGESAATESVSKVGRCQRRSPIFSRRSRGPNFPQKVRAKLRKAANSSKSRPAVFDAGQHARTALVVHADEPIFDGAQVRGRSGDQSRTSKVSRKVVCQGTLPVYPRPGDQLGAVIMLVGARGKRPQTTEPGPP